MKNLFLIFALSIVASSFAFGQSASETATGRSNTFITTSLIKDWSIPGESSRQDFDIYLDTAIFHSGNASGSIKSKLPAGDDKGKSAFLMQIIRADNYLGKKLRMTAYVKSVDVKRAALWMRIEGEGMKVLGLDAMDKRPIKGTTDWQKYDLVLDVPVETYQIVFGVNLKGHGQIWIDDIKLENVGLDVLSTTFKSPAEWEAQSAKRIEQYKITNMDDYEKQLGAFQKRNVTASLIPSNLDFEIKQ